MEDFMPNTAKAGELPGDYPNKLKNGEGQLAQAEHALASARCRLEKAFRPFDVEYYHARIVYETRRASIWRNWLALPASERAEAKTGRDYALFVERGHMREAEDRRHVGRETYWQSDRTEERPNWRKLAKEDRQRRIAAHRAVREKRAALLGWGEAGHALNWLRACLPNAHAAVVKVLQGGEMSDTERCDMAYGLETLKMRLPDAHAALLGIEGMGDAH